MRYYYAKSGNSGFGDSHIVMAQNLRISELSYDDIVGNSQEANSPSISELSYDDIVGNSQEANSPSMLKMLQNFTSATFR